MKKNAQRYISLEPTHGPVVTFNITSGSVTKFTANSGPIIDHKC